MPSAFPLRRRRAAALTVAALLLTGLTTGPAVAAGWPPSAGEPTVTALEYRPGLGGELYLPAPAGRATTVPVVVMAPGGGWVSADRTGLGQLADALAARGVAVYNTTYRIGDDASRFPVPVQDIGCAADAAVAAVRDQGLEPGAVVLLGHSAGAHLSALAALGEDEFGSGDCAHPDSTIDGWVGLSGFYDVALVEGLVAPMLGGTLAEVPEAYRLATPQTHLVAGSRQHLDALVIQGTQDELGITVEYARGFADTLGEHGHRTRFRTVPGGHHATYQAPAVARTILQWLHQVEA